MFEKIKKTGKRMLALLLAVSTTMGAAFTTAMQVQAADGTITFNSGEEIYYGDYATTRMTFDGTNTAYCVEPLKLTPVAGSYAYTLLGNDSQIRKALYYLQGGYGYAQSIQNQYLGGWSEDDAYVIGHLVVAYLFAGGDEWSAFYGAPQNYIDKAKEVVGVINTLPNPPERFKAFLIPGEADQTITGSWYQKPYGWVELYKASANEGISTDNNNYTLKGAQYGIFQGSNQVGTLITDENGYAKSGDLEEGSYTIRELSSSAGYAVDVNSYDINVTLDVTATLEVKEVPQNNPMSLLLQKVDSETKEGIAQGAASLKDAEFTVKYYTEQSDKDPAASGATAKRTWVFKTTEDGKIQFTSDYLISGDDFYYQTDGNTMCLPLGTVTIQETKEPEGYLKNETLFVQKIVGDGSESESVEVFQTPTVEEQVMRGDLEFVKVSDGDLNRLANVPFEITAKKSGESHIIVTDKNGYASTASSWNKHTTNTNEGKTSEDGIWFGTGKVNDKFGALIYDTYEIKELRCESNEGMNLLKFDVTVYKDKVTIPLGTLTDDKVEIGTTAKDKETGTNISQPDDKVTLVDTVDYEGLKKGQSYRIVGTLMEQATNEPLLIDGKEVTAETTFTAKKSTGSVDVTFTFNGISLKGKTVVVFEELYHEDLQLAVHADIEDKNQTIYFPEIGTTAKDAADGDQILEASEKASIVDTVAYKNLVVGETYHVSGVLMDQSTGKELLVDGKQVTADATFLAEKTEGSVDVTFTFNASALADTSVVVFEKVYYVSGEKESQIAAHEDIEDKGQTVSFEKPETPPEEPTPETPNTPKTDAPKTGDTTGLGIWIALIVFSLSGLVGYAVWNRKKKGQMGNGEES